MKLELEHFNSIIALANHFNSEKRYRDFITEQRWHKVVVCPFCGSIHVYTCSNGDNQFKCGDCHKRFSCLVGTIFQNTKLPLQKWFMAMYLGGRETNKHESKKTEGTQGRSTKTKTPIFGSMCHFVGCFPVRFHQCVKK